MILVELLTSITTISLAQYCIPASMYNVIIFGNSGFTLKYLSVILLISVRLNSLLVKTWLVWSRWFGVSREPVL
jgi:hypothetical protein